MSFKRKWWQWAIIGVADVGGTFGGGGVNIATGVSASGLANTLIKEEKK